MAAEGAYVYDETFVADADLSGNQYCFVKLDGSIVNNTPAIVLCAAATDDFIGILQNKPKSGQAALVRMLGRSKCKVDGSGTNIAVKNLIGPNASGLGVAKSAAGNMVAGRALGASTEANDIIELQLWPFSTYQTPA